MCEPNETGGVTCVKICIEDSTAIDLMNTFGVVVMLLLLCCYVVYVVYVVMLLCCYVVVVIVVVSLRRSCEVVCARIGQTHTNRVVATEMQVVLT